MKKKTFRHDRQGLGHKLVQEHKVWPQDRLGLQQTTRTLINATLREESTETIPTHRSQTTVEKRKII